MGFSVPVHTGWGRSCIFSMSRSWAIPPHRNNPPKNLELQLRFHPSHSPGPISSPFPSPSPPSACALRPRAARVGNCSGWLCLTADAGSGDPTGPTPRRCPTRRIPPRIWRWTVLPAAGAGTGVACVLGAAPVTACSKLASPRLFKLWLRRASCRLSGLGMGE